MVVVQIEGTFMFVYKEAESKNLAVSGDVITRAYNLLTKMEAVANDGSGSMCFTPKQKPCVRRS